MLEIEWKFRVHEWDDAKAHLLLAGGRILAARVEVDHYFNAPDRDFRATDEVVRLRCVDDDAVLTYKGPKRTGDVKTRPEIEVPLAVGPPVIADAQKFLLALGFRATAIVRKQREIYTLPRDGFEMHVCFDKLETIGRFIEVEILADESRLSEAEAAIKSVAAELNLTAPEPRSYIRMVLESQGSDA